jgi:hypothetical protein
VLTARRTLEDPDGLTFAVRDLEGNIFSFGSYAGEG